MKSLYHLGIFIVVESFSFLVKVNIFLLTYFIVFYFIFSICLSFSFHTLFFLSITAERRAFLHYYCFYFFAFFIILYYEHWMLNIYFTTPFVREYKSYLGFLYCEHRMLNSRTTPSVRE